MTNQIKSKRSQVITLAHKIKATGLSFAEAQKLAWQMQSVKDAMRNEVISITFTKADGTTTTRTATLKADYLPAQKAQIGETRQRKSISSKITYFELESNTFKSFLPTNFISYEILPAIAAAA